MNLDDELDTFDGGGELEDGEGLGGYEGSHSVEMFMHVS